MLEMWRLRASLMPLCVCVCRPGESIKKQLASLSLARSMLSVCVCVCAYQKKSLHKDHGCVD